MLGKVYNSKVPITKAEPSLMCSVLSYADSWLRTDYYRSLECPIEEEHKVFSDQVLAEAQVLFNELRRSIVTFYETVKSRWSSKIYGFWSSSFPIADSFRSLVGTCSIFLKDLVSAIRILIKDIAKSHQNTFNYTSGTPVNSFNEEL